MSTKGGNLNKEWVSGEREEEKNEKERIRWREKMRNLGEDMSQVLR